MPGYLVDEALPRSLVGVLRTAGIDAVDARDVGLRGRPDGELLGYAVARDLVFLTPDVEIGNVLRYPLGSHKGVVLVRFPSETTTQALNQSILSALRQLPEEELSVGGLAVIAPGSIRLRKRI